jgi:hypothetical protein
MGSLPMPRHIWSVFSKAILAFRDFLAPHFSLLEAYVNGVLFYILRIEHRLDCLDKVNSKITYFKSSPNDVKRIERYHFRKEKIPDPTFFVIPEIQTHVFASQSIRDAIMANQLKGIAAIDIETTLLG